MDSQEAVLVAWGWSTTKCYGNETTGILGARDLAITCYMTTALVSFSCFRISWKFLDGLERLFSSGKYG